MNPFPHMLSVTELHVPTFMQHDALSPSKSTVDDTSHMNVRHVVDALSILYTAPSPHSLSDTASVPAAAPFLSPQVESATQQAALSRATFVGSQAPPAHIDVALAPGVMQTRLHASF